MLSILNSNVVIISKVFNDFRSIFDHVVTKYDFHKSSDGLINQNEVGHAPPNRSYN